MSSPKDQKDPPKDSNNTETTPKVSSQPLQKTSSIASGVSLKTVAEHPEMANRRATNAPTDLDADLCPQAVRDKGYNVLPEVLGEGKFSKVYKATKTTNGKVEDIAVKLIRFDNVESLWRENQLKNELKITKRLKHANIINIFEVIKTRRRAFIFMEKAEYSMESVLKKKIYTDGLPEKYAQGWFEQILKVLAYLHNEKKVAHRDLKTDNILIDSHKQTKLTDFGFATYTRSKDKDIDELKKTHCGTKEYMAPELLYQKSEYDPTPVDMWAAGVILFEMIYNRFPYPMANSNGEPKSTDEIIKLLKTPVKPPMKWGDKENERKISKEARDLIKGLMEHDPKNRLTAEQALKSPWFQIEFPTPKIELFPPTKDGKISNPAKK